MISKDVLCHRCTPHEANIPHSGRYPWGSGNNGGWQHECSFDATVRKMLKDGMSYQDIAIATGYESGNDVKRAASLARQNRKAAELDFCLKEKEMNPSITNAELAKKLGRPASDESYIRNLLKNETKEKLSTVTIIENEFQKVLDNGDYVDIGAGINSLMMVSPSKFQNAVSDMKDKGYNVYYLQVPQASNPKQNTSLKVLANKDTTWSEVNANKEKIKIPVSGYNYDDDGNRTILGIQKPVSVDSKRILVRYNEEGGADKDGVIELRRNVPDLSLGNNNYAQVRIAVDGTHYMKGMAVYSDDMPSIFNHQDLTFGSRKVRM